VAWWRRNKGGPPVPTELADRPVRNPSRLIVLIFMGVVAVGTLALRLPWTHESGVAIPWVDAFFTATSAVTVTGLTVLDTSTAWSTSGTVVILALIQIGGFGILSAGTLLLLFVTRRLGLNTRLLASGESKNLDLGDVRAVLKRIFGYSLAIEIVAAILLTARFAEHYGVEPLRAAWLGIFHSISAFNNAGFTLYGDSLMGFSDDPVFLLIMAVTIILGSIGFPVIFELLQAFRADQPRLSIHSRLTLHGTFILIIGGFLTFLAAEWRNPGTLGPMTAVNKLSNALFASISARTAGFNAIDYNEASQETFLTSNILMLIGGGSASTTGGMKVTTVAVLVLAFIAQIKRRTETVAYDRTISNETVLEAGALALSMVALTLVGTYLVLSLTGLGLSDSLFETVSAVGTSGTSMGFPADMPDPAKIVLSFLMLIGRLGPLTLGAALAFRSTARRYRLPESRPIIG
jgi:trk system potassium uptake protein